MTAVLEPLISSLERFSGFAAESVKVEDVISTLDKTSSNVEIADIAFKSLDVSKSKFGFITVNDQYIGKLTKLVKSANLAEILKLAKRNVIPTVEEQQLFEDAVGDTRELHLSKIENLAKEFKATHAQLSATVEELQSLSRNANKEIEEVESKLIKKYPIGFKIPLTLGVIVVGAYWLTEVTFDRAGCFMLTTINNQKTSCKISQFSCSNSTVKYADACSEGNFINHIYNVTLTLMHIVSLPNDNKMKLDLAELVKLTPQQLSEKLADLIDADFSILRKFVKNLQPQPIFDVCQPTHTSIENATVPACRMCDTSANPISTKYLDAKDLPDNLTFHCNENPNILDTLADLTITTGTNLLEGVESGLISILKPIIILFVIILALIAVITIIVKIALNKSFNFSKKNKDINSRVTPLPTTTTAAATY